MTRELFSKKYGRDCCSYIEFTKDLSALIESEIERATKKEPFERPFRIKLQNLEIGIYIVVDNNNKSTTGWLSQIEAQWLCDQLNRE